MTDREIPIKTILIILCLSLSCKESNIKFNKEGWRHLEDPAFPPGDRDKMLIDLTDHYKLKGLKYSEAIELLGSPDFRDSNNISYEIDVDYGWDIDPICDKRLDLFFSKDSIIRSFRVNEWHKN